MTLPFGQLFPPGRDVTASYNYIDIANGTGVVIFDGFNSIDSTGNNYALSESAAAKAVTASTDNADSVVSTLANSGAGGTTPIDADFDLTTFNRPRTIRGDSYVSVAVAGDTGSSTVLTVTAILRHWDGSTETDLATKSSASTTVQADSVNTFTLKLNATRLFKAGETLRLTIQVAVTTAGRDVCLAHNPNDSAVAVNLVGDFGAGQSRLALTVPFKIDI